METSGGKETRGKEERGGNTETGETKNQRTVEGGTKAGGSEESGKLNEQVTQSPLVVDASSIKGNSIPEPKAKRQYKKREGKSETKSSSMEIGQAEITALISGVFSLVSMKAGTHWQVSSDEAEQVSKPLSNILKKANLLEKVSNVSDGAMLIIALATISIPRIIISQQTKPKESKRKEAIKKELQGGNTSVKESSDTEVTSGKDNSGSLQGSATSWEYGKAIFDTIPQ